MSKQKNSSSAVTNLLNKVAQTTETKKSKVPLINDETFYSEVDAYVTANRSFKDAKVAMEVAEQAIINKGFAWYEGQKGELNSIKYAGTEGAVLVTFKDSFVKIGQEIADEIRLKLKDKFNNFFREKRTISLKESATGDETIDFLLNTLGEAKFVEIFDVKIETVTVPDMDKKQFELPGAVKSLISQYKPALRVS